MLFLKSIAKENFSRKSVDVSQIIEKVLAVRIIKS